MKSEQTDGEGSKKPSAYHRQLLAGIVVVILLVIAWVMKNQKPTNIPVLMPSVTKVKSLAPTTAPTVDDNDFYSLAEEIRRNRPITLAEQLLDKGYPAIPNSRKAALDQTRNQDIAEVVADLGNQMSIIYGGVAAGDGASFPNQIGWWRNVITLHVKTLRLIEEGRSNPASVHPLLRKAIDDSLSGYATSAEMAKAEWVRVGKDERRNPEVSDNDPYYAKHHHYEDPIIEQFRRNDVFYSSLYILANIGRFDCPEILSEWIQLDVPESVWHPRRSPQMDAWLIDAYYHQEKSSQAAIRHAQIVGDAVISQGKTTRSRWNELWEKSDPMLQMRGAGISGFKTIEIMEIPGELPLPNETTAKVIANFIEHTKKK